MLNKVTVNEVCYKCDCQKAHLCITLRQLSHQLLKSSASLNQPVKNRKKTTKDATSSYLGDTKHGTIVMDFSLLHHVGKVVR
jgi:hypothetical protein